MGNIPSQAHVDLAAHVNNFHLKTGDQITQMKADALNHRLNQYETSILPDWLSDTCLFILLLTTIGLIVYSFMGLKTLRRGQEMNAHRIGKLEKVNYPKIIINSIRQFNNQTTNLYPYLIVNKHILMY